MKLKIMLTTAAAQDLGQLFKKLISILKPLYNYLISLLHSYWNWLTSGSLYDVIVKFATVTLLALGVAFLGGNIARAVQYLIYAVCIVVIMMGVAAVLAKCGILHTV